MVEKIKKLFNPFSPYGPHRGHSFEIILIWLEKGYNK
jgi:hypothetical protein